MEDVKLNVRALAANMKISIKELAELAEIKPDRLLAISNERVPMYAKELFALSRVTGVPVENIKF